MMLEELVLLLEPFQWTTDEFQSNEVSISRVFPSIKYLNEVLEEKKDEIKILKTFCTSLITNLNIRFGQLIDNDVFVVSTFLDPTFGLHVFETSDQNMIKKKHKKINDGHR